MASKYKHTVSLFEHEQTNNNNLFRNEVDTKNSKHIYIYTHKYCILLLLFFKNVGNARLEENDKQPISPKTTASQYQPIE